MQRAPLAPIIAVLSLEVLLHMSELAVLATQAKGRQKSGVDPNFVKYQRLDAKISLLDKSLTMLFFLGVAFSFRKMRKLFKRENAFFSAIFIFKWLITELPPNFIRHFYLDRDSRMMPSVVINFVKQEIVTKLFYLLFLNVAVKALVFLARATKSFKHAMEINPLINPSEESAGCSISSGSDPFYSKSSINHSKIRAQKRRILDDYANSRPFYKVTAAALFAVLLMDPFAKTLLSKLNGTVETPNIPFQSALAVLFYNYGLQFRGSMIQKCFGKTDKLLISVQGVLRRNLLVPENIIHSFETKDLVPLIAAKHPSMNSYEGLLHFAVSAVEILLAVFIVRKIITDNFPELSSMARRQLTIIVPIFFAYFVPAHVCFEVLHSLISKAYVMKGDEYALSIGLPITDALVKLYIQNCDIVTHFRLYELLIKQEPSITQRLANIAVAKLKAQPANPDSRTREA